MRIEIQWKMSYLKILIIAEKKVIWKEMKKKKKEIKIS
jgi:hypothetical protein